MEITGIVISILVSILGFIVATSLSKIRRRNDIETKAVLKKKQKESYNKFIDEIIKDASDEATKQILFQELETYFNLSISAKDNSQKEIKDLTTDLQMRIENIEKRFPEESTLEKLASINDAILSTKIEELLRSINRIEEKMLSRWDVAKIVFVIIGSIGTLIGLTITVIKFLTNQ